MVEMPQDTRQTSSNAVKQSAAGPVRKAKGREARMKRSKEKTTWKMRCGLGMCNSNVQEAKARGP